TAKLKATDQVFFNFLSKNRVHHIKSVVVNSYKNSGLYFLDFTTLNMTLKINWMKQLLRNDKLADAVDTAYCLGKSRQTDVGGRPRAIILQFMSRVCRDAVWRTAKTSSYLKSHGLQFMEDFSKEDRKRRQLWPEVQKARAAGKTAYFVGAKAYIQGEVITCYSTTLIVVNIYGFNSQSKNDQLLNLLEERLVYWRSKYPEAYLLIGRDFIVVLDEAKDRWPPGQPSLPPGSLSEEERLRLTELQSKLDDVYRVRAEGAFIRSRQKWLEHGEQMSTYFFKLEKSQAKLNFVFQLNVEGSVTNSPEEISNFCYNYYSTLYKSKFSDDDMAAFSKYLSTLNCLSEDEALMCDSPITVEEIMDAIKCLKNKSPGNDEIIAEFYKLFPELIVSFLFEVYSESIARTALPAISGIPVKEKVNYLGIQTSKDPLDRIALNFNPMI
ncbi:hypothetical protein Z043_119039, partial [Scleropages formosus]